MLTVGAEGIGGCRHSRSSATQRAVAPPQNSNGDARDARTGQCTPDCSEVEFNFPWTISVNGQSSHSMNANRVSMVYPRAGEIEHWTYVNEGGGWDHLIHLHFEEGITMNRGASFPATENLVRKDVWRLRPGGRVQFQVQFGEYGGSYVNHCHNRGTRGLRPPDAHPAADRRSRLAPDQRNGTPNPTPDGVFFTTPEILPEGDPAQRPDLFPANGRWWWQQRQGRQRLTSARPRIGEGPG